MQLIFLSAEKVLAMNFPCNICNKVLKRRSSLKNHTRRFHPATEEETIKCTICNKSFSRIFDMKKHTAKIHFYEDKDNLPEESKDLEASKELEDYSDIEPNNESQNHINYKQIVNSTSSDEIKGSETAVEFQKNVIGGSKEIHCNFCSKQFKTKTDLLQHMSRIHNITQYQGKNLVQDVINGLKNEYDIDIFEIKNVQKMNKGFILKNAENIMELLNTQNYHNSQIKKIDNILFPIDSNKSKSKMFACQICSKSFSTKGSLYGHKSRYHKISKDQVSRCEKCDDYFKNETDKAIHNYRFHRASL